MQQQIKNGEQQNVTEDNKVAVHSIDTIKERIKKKNIIAEIIFAIALIIYLFGFINGFMKGLPTSFTEAMKIWREAFLTGTVFLGLAEIISLLQDIKNK